MGLSGVSIPQLTILLLIVALVFGTKKLRNMGEDLGAAVSSFKKGMKDQEDSDEPANIENKS